MASFTSLLKKGKRRFIDKYLVPRKFGRCEGCSRPALLIKYVDVKNPQDSLGLCESCYTVIINSEK